MIFIFFYYLVPALHGIFHVSYLQRYTFLVEAIFFFCVEKSFTEQDINLMEMR